MEAKQLRFISYKELGFMFAFILSSFAYCFWKSQSFHIDHLLKTPNLDAIESTILLQIRLPRFIIATLVGGSLGAAGVLSQNIFRNSLASPSILGISGASNCFACLINYFNIHWLHWLIIPLGAFVGGIINLLILYILIKRSFMTHVSKLLLAGLALSTLWGSMTSFLISISFEDHQKVRTMMHWLLGGFSGLGWPHVQLAAAPLIASMLAAYSLGTRLDILVLGDEIASSLGVNVKQTKTQVLLLIAILIAVVVSIAGILPFIGLLIPHLTRLIVGNEHKKLIFYSIINGATLTIVSDLIAKNIRAPIEMDVGIFTSLLGAPFFIFMLIKNEESI